ncbi:hypothetical protein [Streptomyces camelliae]|uniref:DUF1828 domain-containing protein n=1 Tax=Streptomyces camelliae TaxID=3004093 RepID=A0ABY7NZZ1_9ACTN|nr:hypothetical protein [Streptomyces sp. HUAS 2-6]WBO63815.1 hypothetical protein O1G22_13760 [Streptomyces sp. HUAS 2-6]
MSYDVFVCRFLSGESIPLNKIVATEVLAPHVVAQDPEHGLFQIRTKDGASADLYFTSDTSIMINHFTDGGVMNVISELLDRIKAVLVLPGGTVILSQDSHREHLPQTLRDEWSVIVATTGSQITQAIQAS